MLTIKGQPLFRFRENYLKYGPTPSSHDLLKFIAIIIMVIDHTGHFFFHDDLLWRAVGRIGFPIWFFLAGYARPSRMDRELIILAVALVVVKVLFHQPLLPVNALVTIMACRYFVTILSRHEFKTWQSFYYIIGLTIWIPTIFIFEYGTMGLMFALMGYLVKTQPGSLDAKLAAVLSTLVFLFMQNVNYDFDFTVVENLVMCLGTAGSVYYLYHFKLSFLPLKTVPGWMKAAMFLGRNSLYVYFFHLVLFIIMARFIYPESHNIFKWM